MATILLLVIYSAFIGLGIPDSVLSSCWPSIQTELNLPIYFNGFLNILINLCTMFSSLLSPKIVKKLGTGLTTAISTLCTAIALLLYSFSYNYIFLIILSIPLGFGAGAIDSGLNTYVANHYKAVHMNFLHCFYGLGVFLSPLLMSLALKNTTWHVGYRNVAFFQFVISLFAFLSLPLWNKKEQDSGEKNEISNGYREVLKIKQVRYGCLVFLFSCALEFTCGNWATTYFVKIRGVSPSIGAIILGVYYIGMALGRFTSGIISKRIQPLNIVLYGLIIVSAGIILLCLPVHYYLGMFALFIIGFGNGPVFPNLTHETPVLYGKENSRSIISLQMTGCYIGCSLVPFIFGLISKKYLVIFPFFILLFYLLTFLTYIFIYKSAKKQLFNKNV